MDTYLQKELDILLEEYKALRSELVLTMGNTRQILQLSLIAIGVFLAASPKIVDSGYPVLFLIIPFCLYGLSLTFLRYLFLHIEIIDHIHHVVTPRVRSILKDLCSDGERDLNGVMSWEDKSGYSGPLERYNVFYWPIPIGPQFVPLIGSAVSLAAYFFITKDCITSRTILETMLAAVNIIALIYLCYVGYKVGSRTVRTSDISDQAAKSINNDNMV